MSGVLISVFVFNFFLFYFMRIELIQYQPLSYVIVEVNPDIGLTCNRWIEYVVLACL